MSNLLNNYFFEADIITTDPPTEWGRLNDVIGCTRQVSSDFFHEGGKSLKISNPIGTADEGILQTEFTRSNGIITVIPGNTITVGGWIKTNLTAGNCHIHVKLFQSGYTNEIGFDTALRSGISDWKYDSLKIIVPSGYIIAEVILCFGAYGTSATGDAWFDEIYLGPYENRININRLRPAAFSPGLGR